MATVIKTDKQIVMEMIQKAICVAIDDLPPVQKKTLKLREWQPIGEISKVLEASFKELADHLVSEVQVCNECGNEIHFDKYAVYPNAKIDLPENFGQPYILEQVWQFNPKREKELDKD